MTEEPGDLRELVSQLSRRIIEDHLRNVRANNEVRQLVAQGLIDQRTVDEAYLDYAREEGEQYRRRLANLSVRYYATLLELGNQWSDRFYERILRGIQQPAPSAEGAHGRPAPQPIPLELAGYLGDRVQARFELGNDRETPVTISFLVGPFTGPRGEMFRPMLVLEPASLVLAPGSVESVTLQLLLEPGLFQVGRIYSGSVEVVGHSGVALALTVWARERVTGPETAPPAAAAEPPQAGPPDVAAPDPATPPTRAPVSSRRARKATPRTTPAKTAATTRTPRKAAPTPRPPPRTPAQDNPDSAAP